ncbi:helix-turn-helix domain-containing protein [Streptomyces sp. NPDC090077]|uniref:helix-turn-helix domain-containing protein n=1 Tax=Streptomyces sp. NPDC090077 TaxID=3365938 RepID=UPI00382E0B17
MTSDVEASSGSELGLPSPEERRWLRESGGLTYEEVAAEVGVTAATVRSWECGRTEPRGRTREAYAGLLDRLATAGAAPVRPVAAGPPAHRPRTLLRRATQPPTPLPQTTHWPPEPTRNGPTPDGRTSGSPAPDGRMPGGPTLDGHAPGSPALDGQNPGAPAPDGPAAGGQVPGTPPHHGPPLGGPPLGSRALEGPDPGGRAPGGQAPGNPAAYGPPSGDPAPSSPVPDGPTPDGPFRQEDGQAVGHDEPADGVTTPEEPFPHAAPAPAPGPAAASEEPFPQGGAEPPVRGPVYGPRPRPPRDAVEAFDALYDHAAAALVRQAYLLTGRRALALHSVEVAFRQAWGRWPEVATDRDPVGWVRSAAHEYALSPWHRFRRAHRHPDRPPADTADRILLEALLALPPVHRRTVLLYDGVGLDLPDTAAETEASTPATGHRLLRAHAELARRIPLLADVPPERRSAMLRERFAAVRPAVSLEPRPAAVVRTVSEHRARRLARAALVLTAVIAASTGYTTVTAPDHYEPPVAPGASVSGVPPLSGPPRLTETSRELQDKLRADPAAGPHRLHPRLE